jgi:probable rRNA maturation factor
MKLPEETETTVVFLNDRQMRRYNLRYRKKNASTDVLSFSVNEIFSGQHYLGDILISLESVDAQAQELGHSFKKELEVLLLHGMLHLLGFDHETDSGQMDRLERRLRKQLRLPPHRAPLQNRLRVQLQS